MPFTLSHCAAALPFRRSRLPLSALLVGCLAPDFEYLVRLSDYDRIGHTFPGFLLVTLPASFLFLWLFHEFLRWPLCALLPRPLEQRTAAIPQEFSFRGPARAGLVILGLATGIATHITWDSFTHGDSWVALHWSFFHYRFTLSDRLRVPVYAVLQGISTLAGLAAVACWFTGWLRRTSPARPDPRFRVLPEWFKLALLAMMAAFALALAYCLTLQQFGPFVRRAVPGFFYADMAAKSLALFSWQLLLYAAAWTALARKPRARTLAS